MLDADRRQLRVTPANFTNFQGELYELEWASVDGDGQLWRPTR